MGNIRRRPRFLFDSWGGGEEREYPQPTPGANLRVCSCIV